MCTIYRIVTLLVLPTVMAQALDAQAAPFSATIDISGGGLVGNEFDFMPPDFAGGESAIDLASDTHSFQSTWSRTISPNHASLFLDLRATGDTWPADVVGEALATLEFTLEKRSRTQVLVQFLDLPQRGLVTGFNQHVPEVQPPNKRIERWSVGSTLLAVKTQPGTRLAKRTDETFLRGTIPLSEYQDLPAGTYRWNLSINLNGSRATGNKHQSVFAEIVRFVPGDIDRSGRFDQNDLVLLLQHGDYLGTSRTAPNDDNPFWLHPTRVLWSPDINFSGGGPFYFDQLDVVEMLKEGWYLKDPYVPITGANAPNLILDLPEPASLLLVVNGLAAAFLTLRSNRKRGSSFSDNSRLASSRRRVK